MIPEQFRARFPILEHKIHLANCSQAPLSIDVRQALDRYQQSLIEEGMAWEIWMGEVRAARAEFAHLIEVEPEDIAVLSCVSDAISAIAGCLPIGRRRQVVTTIDEFPTVGHGWLAAADHGRAEVRFVRSADGFYPPELVEPAMGPETALLSVHLVSYTTAARQDVMSLARLAHAHGAYILVDAYQALGTLAFDVRQNEVDILVCGNLKYLLGLPGIAFMYVRPGLSDELRPAATGWFGRINPFNFDPTHLDFAPGARRFDMGTPPIAAAYAALAGMRLIREVGVEAIERHVLTLSRQVISGALERGFSVASPHDVTRKGASTALRFGARSAELERRLKARGIIVSARGDVLRIAPHLFTTPDDITAALDALAEEAA
ncbi:MAG: aminotransferase class V-fold PLP-dependent enzyme [Chloroflexota bacterium]